MYHLFCRNINSSILSWVIYLSTFKLKKSLKIRSSGEVNSITIQFETTRSQVHSGGESGDKLSGLGKSIDNSSRICSCKIVLGFLITLFLVSCVVFVGLYNPQVSSLFFQLLFEFTNTIVRLVRKGET